MVPQTRVVLKPVVVAKAEHFGHMTSLLLSISFFFATREYVRELTPR